MDFFYPASKHTPIPHFSGLSIPHTHSWEFALFTEQLITVWKSLSQSFLRLFVTGIITDQLWEILGSIKYRACFVCWPWCLDFYCTQIYYVNLQPAKGDGKKALFKQSMSQQMWLGLTFYMSADRSGNPIPSQQQFYNLLMFNEHLLQNKNTLFTSSCFGGI